LNQTIAVWILILFAVAAANLPFLNERVLGVLPYKRAKTKPVWVVCLELMVLYLISGVLGFAFERALSNPFEQRWEFYAITLCIFLVFGFPGFVYRYLLKARG